MRDVGPRTCLAGLAAAIALTGCLAASGSAVPTATETSDPVPPETISTSKCTDPSSARCSPVGRDWVFVEIDGFDGPLPAPPPVAGFILTREGRRLSGSTACNRLGGGYEIGLSGGTLRFTGLRNTRGLCDRIAADTEEAVLETMIATDGFRLDDRGHLELLSGGKVLARLVAP